MSVIKNIKNVTIILVILILISVFFFNFDKKTAYDIEDETTRKVESGELEFYSAILLEIQEDRILVNITSPEHRLSNQVLYLEINRKTNFITVEHIDTQGSPEFIENIISIDDLIIGEDLFIYATYDGVVDLIEKPSIG